MARKRRVRVVLMGYEPPDKDKGRPVGRYRALAGYGKTIEITDERAAIRLWDTLRNAADLFIADEIVAGLERSGAVVRDEE